METRMMDTRIWMMCVAVSLGLAAPMAVLAQEPESVARQGGVRVEVVSVETRRPLEGVTVTPRLGSTLSAPTSTDGVVEFGALAEELYDVTAVRSGLLRVAEPSVRVVRRKVTPLRLEMQVRERVAPDEVALDASALEEVIVRAGERPPPESNGISYLKIPMDAL